MHYYKFDIGKWDQSTSWMLPESEGIYLRLINHYYDKQKPIPEDYRQTLKRLRLLSYMELVDEILHEYFVLTDKGWIHEVCDRIITDYEKSAKQNRINGSKGGRPIQGKPLPVTESDTDGLPVATESQPDGNLNQELLITNNKKDTPKKKKQAFSEPDMGLARTIFQKIKTINPNAKEPNFNSWANTIRLMVTQDKRQHQDIGQLFTWANQHDFWHQNILSPVSLRKQWDKLWMQRTAQANGGGRSLRLPADDNALAGFAKKNKLAGTRAGETFWEYRNRLNSEMEIKADK